ncbi:MAG: dihydroorotase [Salibacteraceae bacterium]|jgi:dihydroorotase
MSLLIKKAKIVDSTSTFHLQTMDILIEHGKITVIKDNITEDHKNVISGKSIHVSPGWMDLHAEFNEPGLEHKEDLTSGAYAAKNGGFSTVVISANTYPVTETKSHLSFITHSSNSLPIEIKSFGALSEQLRGENFTELYELHLAGAVGFSDGLLPISNPDLLKRTLLYSKAFGGKVVVYPSDRRISHDGVMHEGTSSTRLGLKSEPSLSEEVMVARDLAIAAYCESPIHFRTISTQGAVDQIKRAKKRGVQVTCDVAIANLLWNDTALEGFNSNYKVTPPLRGEKDRKALIKGVNEGTIDCIVSNHNPQNIEEKQCEFDLAAFGQSAIETSYSAYQTFLSDKISIEKWVEVTSLNPRQIFNQSLPSINEGELANVTIFDLDTEWDVTAKTLKSKSKNTPLIGTTLTGKVLDVIC